MQAHSLQLDNMKIYFSNLSNEIWAEQRIGLDLFKMIVEFLCLFCLKSSMKCPMFSFRVNVANVKYDVTLCWHTLHLMLGLSQCEAQYVKKELLDHTRCNFFWKKVNDHVAFLRVNGKQTTDRWWYKYVVPNFVIAVEECGKAVRLSKTKLGGTVVTLSQGSMANLDNLFTNHKPSHSMTTAVSHGGHNILYGKFS